MATTLNKLLSKVDRLEAEVASLKVENATVKLELERNHALVLKRLDFVNINVAKVIDTLRLTRPTGPSYANVTRNGAKKAVEEVPVVLPTNTKKPKVANEAQAASGEPASAAPLSLDNASLGSVARTASEEGWNPVRNRRKPEVRSGASKSTALTTVPRGPARKALFVTRLHPDTSTEDVVKFVSDVAMDDALVCTRLRSKFPSYSSFHVLVSANKFDLINDPLVWPEGCLFRQFRGTLKTDERENAAT